MSINMTTAVREDLDGAEDRFRRACEQVLVLNKKMEYLTSRYNEAEARGNKPLCYQLRLRISVIEGVRNMFYEYAAQQANVMTELQRHILSIGVDHTSDDSSIPGLAYGSNSDDIGADDSLEFC